ncbi:MAG TPA: hypothetical protein VFA46_08770 [Actinomycetes bacterium]|jgi:hypothetical protein|nr:hypothetical protein [Actinomycetes bacterium]
MLGRAVVPLSRAVVPLVVLGYVVYLVLGVTSPRVTEPAAFTLDDAVWVLGQVVLVVVGALIVSRRRGIPIGWLFCAAGLIGLVEGIAARYAVHELAGAPGSPSGGVAAWLSAVLWYPNIALLVLAGLLFPSGRPPSRRWWGVAWLLAAGGPLAVAAMLLLWPVRGLDLLNASPGSPRAPLATALMNVAALVLVAGGVATAVALLVRFRRAWGVERQQLKWLTYTGALAVVGLLLFLLPSAVGVSSLPGPLRVAGTVLVTGGVLGIPVAVGVAILRYRLYDIDRLINRTLVYGLLTALLGLLYAGVVLGVGQLFGGVGAKPPNWAVAAATLAVATLFQPARHRLQAAVDRRFNRRRYHAARTIEAFSARLRQQVDLDSLTAELLAVVEQTMEPTQVSLWLRAPTR